MAALAQQRCHNHVEREAVARCPECGQFFCRECVVEHEDRVLCAACLRRLTKTASTKISRFARVALVLQVAFGSLVAWIFFYGIGRTLLTIPASFHDGTIWHSP